MRGGGAAVLFLYSLVHTRGIEQIRKDVGAYGELPLVYGQFWVCSSELTSLVIRGEANGNVGAYKHTGS